MAYQLQFASFRLAAGQAGIFLLDRHRARVYWFDAEGRHKGRVPCPLSQPLDIATHDSVVLVADIRARGVWVCHLTGKTPPNKRFPGTIPTSVDMSADRVAYADRRLHQVVVVDRASGREQLRVNVGVVTNDSTVTLLSDGSVLLVSPDPPRVLLVQADGTLAGVHDDPRFLLNRTLIQSPTAASLDPEGGEFLLIGENQAFGGNLSQGSPSVDPDENQRSAVSGQGLKAGGSPH